MTSAKMTATTTPIAIPAFAPVEMPDECAEPTFGSLFALTDLLAPVLLTREDVFVAVGAEAVEDALVTSDAVAVTVLVVGAAAWGVTGVTPPDT